MKIISSCFKIQQDSDYKFNKNIYIYKKDKKEGKKKNQLRAHAVFFLFPIYIDVSSPKDGTAYIYIYISSYNYLVKVSNK